MSVTDLATLGIVGCLLMFIAVLADVVDAGMERAIATPPPQVIHMPDIDPETFDYGEVVRSLPK